jgi:secondary thiamine-phosphate synthase enzyme
MKSYTEYIQIETDKEKEIVNITDRVKNALRISRITEGICLVNSMHITSSVFINDEEEGLKEDILEWLEKLAPDRPDYRHHKTGETNADSHLKRTILGREVVIAITKGRLDLGTWEQVFYGEFDGKRLKKVLVKIIGE